MKNTFGILIFLTGIMLLIGISAFYWFQWRPSSVKKTCAEEATNKYDNSVMANRYYGLCLIKQRVKPESLFIK